MTNDTDDTELTALQTIMQDKRAATELLADLEGAETNHEAAENPERMPRWEIKLEIHPDDLPAMRRELREYIEDDEP